MKHFLAAPRANTDKRSGSSGKALPHAAHVSYSSCPRARRQPCGHLGSTSAPTEDCEPAALFSRQHSSAAVTASLSARRHLGATRNDGDGLSATAVLVALPSSDSNYCTSVATAPAQLQTQRCPRHLACQLLFNTSNSGCSNWDSQRTLSDLAACSSSKSSVCIASLPLAQQSGLVATSHKASERVWRMHRSNCRDCYLARSADHTHAATKLERADSYHLSQPRRAGKRRALMQRRLLHAASS